jgi:AcrR family transcriptional regulator
VAEQSTQRLERLPRGRHKLPREAVAQSQRARILGGMIKVVSERGYSDARIHDAIAEAGVSRKTFYEFFDDKEDCFLAAYDVIFGILLESTTEGYESKPEAAWAERIRLGLTNFLELMAKRPVEAKFCIVEVLAAGPKALARRDAAVRQFTHFFDAGRAETTVELPGITSLALVGGINELLYSEILHGATRQLPARLPELMFWITYPFLGAEQAAAERDRARRLMREAG